MRMVSGVVLLALLVTAAAAETDGAKLVGPFGKAEYPQSLIDRPLTLPAGMVEGELGASFVSLRLDPSPFDEIRPDEWIGDVAVRVGVTDRIQVEAGTAFSLDYVQRGDDFQGVSAIDIRPSLTSWKRVVPLRLSFLALDTDALDTALTLTLPFMASSSQRRYFRRGGSVVIGDPNHRVLKSVDLAAPTRWRLTDWFWLRAGENLFSVTTDRGVATFAFDLGVGVQPHPMFAVTLDTRIASISFDGDGEEASQTLADLGTIDLEGTFSPCRWFDFVGSLGMFDVGDGFDDYVTRMAVRVRF